MKKLILANILLGIFLLSGCISEKENSYSALSNKPGLVILQNSTAGKCETEATRQTLYQRGYRGIILKEVSNSSTCATFGRVQGDTCRVFKLNNPYGSVACAVGFDRFTGAKTTENIAIYEILEIVN